MYKAKRWKRGEELVDHKKLYENNPISLHKMKDDGKSRRRNIGMFKNCSHEEVSIYSSTKYCLNDEKIKEVFLCKFRHMQQK
ncbi:MAG: hypothetical protein WBZ36_22090 [Candidatus Nitrosopolaris sp.]